MCGKMACPPGNEEHREKCLWECQSDLQTKGNNGLEGEVKRQRLQQIPEASRGNGQERQLL